MKCYVQSAQNFTKELDKEIKKQARDMKLLGTEMDTNSGPIKRRYLVDGEWKEKIIISQASDWKTRTGELRRFLGVRSTRLFAAL